MEYEVELEQPEPGNNFIILVRDENDKLVWALPYVHGYDEARDYEDAIKELIEKIAEH